MRIAWLGQLLPIASILMPLLLLSPTSAAKEQQGPRDKFGVPITKFHINKSRNGKVLVTELDDILPRLTQARRSYLQGTMQRMDSLYRYNWEQGKIQTPVSASTPFPCNTTGQPMRSAEPPTSVHRLRPGDVDITSSIGDSLTAGTGTLSATIVDLVNEYRSLSFSNGGRGTWRTYLTLPNILRVYNANLYGYASKDSTTLDRASVFNVAEPASMSRDMPFQARVLIKRLQRDRRVDMKRHWKLLTIFMGNNDVCSDVCHFDSTERLLRQHEQDLRKTLTLLRQQVPRLFVNLVPTINPVTSILKIRNKPWGCYVIHTVGCSCVFKAGRTPAQTANLSKLIERWQAVDERVAALPEFRTDDLVVNFRNFNFDADFFTLPNGESDLRMFASDCFHLSQLGHAVAANALWNSMFENITKVDWPFKKFACPTQERPYLVTWANNGGRG